VAVITTALAGGGQAEIISRGKEINK